MFPRGWIKVVLTYRCKWCDYEEVVTVTETEGDTLDWIYDGATGTMELCSTDCQKERDACIQQTYANLEPSPDSACEPDGFEAEYQRIRYEALKVRGLSHRITQLKLF